MSRVKAVLIRGVEYNWNTFIGRDNVGIVAILEVTQGKGGLVNVLSHIAEVITELYLFYSYKLAFESYSRSIKEKILRGHDTHPIQPKERHDQDRPAQNASRSSAIAH